MFCIFAGPWFIGEVIEGHYGAAFAYGTYVNGYFLPGAFSYFYGVVQVKKIKTISLKTLIQY
jgi:hypothetical protein